VSEREVEELLTVWHPSLYPASKPSREIHSLFATYVVTLSGAMIEQCHKTHKPISSVTIDGPNLNYHLTDQQSLRLPVRGLRVEEKFHYLRM
jgi:hypothetical protein